MTDIPIIRLEKVNKSYFNGINVPKRKVLKNVDFKVNGGDSIAITGPSGTGKSTLLNIMGVLDRPDSGELYFKGKEIIDMDENSLSLLRNKSIGFIFQQHHLLPQLTLLENVMLPLIEEKDTSIRRAALLRAMQWIQKVGLEGRENQFPWQLSGGELQRTSVVRALINEPEIILADEPTGSLDEENATSLIKLLTQINIENGIALVMVTHAIDFARQMKHHYEIHDGKLNKS